MHPRSLHLTSVSNERIKENDCIGNETRMEAARCARGSRRFDETPRALSTSNISSITKELLFIVAPIADRILLSLRMESCRLFTMFRVSQLVSYAIARISLFIRAAFCRNRASPRVADGAIYHSNASEAECGGGKLKQ